MALAAAAQPRSLEVFAGAGWTRLGGDEGSPGSTASWGGALSIPLTSRWAVDLTLSTMRLSRQWAPDQPERYSSRRILILPALVRRWGAARVYGFLGAGAGLQVDDSTAVYRVYELMPPGAYRILTARMTETGLAWHGRGGLVVPATSRLLVRAELGAAFRYVLPTVGFVVSLGYRF